MTNDYSVDSEKDWLGYAKEIWNHENESLFISSLPAHLFAGIFYLSLIIPKEVDANSMS